MRFRILMLLAVAACGQVAPTTAARLAAMDPLSADPAGIELAVVMPPGMDALPGTAVLKLQIAMGEESRDESFSLVERAAPTEVPVPDGAHARAYRLAPADAATMRALQIEARAWKDGGGQGSATLGAALAGCRLDAGPQPGAEGAVFIRLDESMGFMPLIGPAPLTALLGPQAISGLRPCGGAR